LAVDCVINNLATARVENRLSLTANPMKRRKKQIVDSLECRGMDREQFSELRHLSRQN